METMSRKLQNKGKESKSEKFRKNTPLENYQINLIKQ